MNAVRTESSVSQPQRAEQAQGVPYVRAICTCGTTSTMSTASITSTPRSIRTTYLHDTHSEHDDYSTYAERGLLAHLTEIRVRTTFDTTYATS